ncbi:hypothetical protein J2T13_003589 [Paenibacillus sp. DS2015]|uniref:hypothetical protein n=1 Tax=Paenibacillus sp. DS2015 TaxID=3373917 RepID=UPI003D1A07C1
MSNTSPFNENNKNNNVMFPRGGEKKVMKKILSVALSTAMAFSMFASVAFADTAVTPESKFNALKDKGIFNGYPDGKAHLEKEMTRAEFAKVITKVMGLKEISGVLSYNDKNYTAKNWAVTYIEAVSAAGLMEGKNVTKKIFDFNGNVTVEELAAVLVRALELEVPTTIDNTASVWAKGYVQAAINAGLVSQSSNFQKNATRTLLVEAAYAVDELRSIPTVASYVVSEGGKVVDFTLSNKEVVKVTLEKALEANKETEITFKTADGKEITTKVTYVVESATKVVSASSVNLKEVDVAFDGKLNAATATDKNNYSIDAGAKGIKSITLNADTKSVRILLNESSKFVQGTSYKVVVKNVKSSTGTVLPQGEVSFTSSDNVLPTVSEVKALGTKVIKVTFSEPIVAPTSSNFQLDDKAFVGSVTQGANQREVILRDYTGSISVGTHKLTTSLVEDYAGLKSLSATTEFNVAVDSEGPKVTDISATLEKVTVTFDEEIDPASVTNDSFYWKNGTSNKTGKVTQVASNVYEVEFNSDNRLPGYEATLFVEVKDYSGNANAVKEHKINASVDLVRPQVVETTFGDRTNTLTVRFDKAVTAADKKYFTVKKGSDVIPVSSVVAADSSNKIFYVNFFSTLASGTYNVKVADVQDTTALRNTLVEYNGTFVANDTANPSISSTDYNESTRKVTLNFGREMDLATINVKGNYYINFQKDGANAQNIALPSEVSVNAVNGSKSVVLQFPEYIEGTKVTFGPNGSVKGVVATGLKSKTGQVVSLDSSSLKDAAANQLKWTNAVQKDAKTFELTFNQVIASASIGDFQINGAYPASVSIDENKVTLKASDETTGGTINLFANNSIETYSNNKLNLSSNASMPVNNTVAPRVTKVEDIRSAVDNSFIITFSTSVTEGVYGQLENDFIVRNTGVTNSPKIATSGYTAEVTSDTKQVKITIIDPDALNKPISVQVRKDAEYLVSATDNKVVAVESGVYNVAAPSSASTNVSVTSTEVTNKVDGVKASAIGDQITLTATETGINTGKITIVTAPVAGVVPAAGEVASGSIAYNATTKTYTVAADVTVKVLLANINATQAADYTAKAIVDEALAVTADDLTFAGGVAYKAGTLTVKLSKAVASIKDDKVTIDSKTYTGDKVALNGSKNAIIVTLGDDAVAGGQFKATVVDGTKEVPVSVTIASK